MYIPRQKFQQFDDSTILILICVCWHVFLSNSEDSVTRDILLVLLLLVHSTSSPTNQKP